jgi:hypothetical protein
VPVPRFSFEVVTDVAPGRFVEALCDFSPGRPQRWPNLDRRYYQVHAVTQESAEVTEGSAFAGGVWERSRYDWHTPGVVRIEVVDSNAFAAGSSWLYQLYPAGDGTRIRVTIDRRPGTVKGRLLAVPLTLIGRRIFRADLQRVLARLASVDV